MDSIILVCYVGGVRSEDPWRGEVLWDHLDHLDHNKNPTLVITSSPWHFFQRNVGVVIAGLQWAKENITSAKFCCFWIWSVSFLFISVFEKSLKVIIAYANLNLSDKKWRIKSRYENFWWTIISSSIYLPTFSVISVLFKLSRQKCKRNPFLSIQGELFNSAVGKRDIMHRRTIKKFLYTVIISNEIVFH